MDQILRKRVDPMPMGGDRAHFYRQHQGENNGKRATYISLADECSSPFSFFEDDHFNFIPSSALVCASITVAPFLLNDR